MEIALCGLPRSGKTTLWSILTGQAVPAGGKVESRRGVTHVPDARLDRLNELYRPKKKVPATVTYVDVAPMERGAGRRADNPALVALRDAEALLLVLRAWDDEADPHPEGSIDPGRDLELIETEFLLADLEVAQRRLEKLHAVIKKANRSEDKAERDVLQRVVAGLEAERTIRGQGLTDDESRMLRGYAFLSAKPLLVAVNLPEDRIGDIGADPAALGLPDLAGRAQCDFVALSAKIEQEIAAFSEEEARAFRDDMGIESSALERLIQASYRLLGLIAFFTVGDDECRAWTIRQGTPAQFAAGAIHTDLHKRFIRAETIEWDKLLESGSMAAAKDKGWLRLEGKEYVVRDGDVMHVRHSA
jgi:ribosome-binding ATPase